MGSKIDAIERCAYCRNYVPVTPVTIGAPGETAVSARVSVCEKCQQQTK